MTQRNCYLFAGGGTGGHLTPGLAVAAEILNDDCGARIIFVGSDRPLEKRLIAAAGYEHCVLPVESSAMLRRNPLRFAWQNWRAFRMARGLVDAERPKAVIGLGGFASVPSVLAATRRQIPTIVLEQNALPGRATRFLCRRVAAVCTAMGDVASKLPAGARIELTGNPVRREIADLYGRDTAAASRPTEQTLLILGGSQGAESLNEAVVGMLEERPSRLAGWQIVHQTGAAQYERIAEAYRRAEIAGVVRPFFEDLSDWYARATLVIARAGATTLAELACAGCPVILLPYPHAADNHQLANARVFERAGAAIAIDDTGSPAETTRQLATAVILLAEDVSRQAAMRQAMGTLARPDAAQKVVAVLKALLTKSVTQRR